MEKKRNKRNNRKKFIKISLTKLFLVTALLLTAAQIILSNRLATSGGELEDLSEKIRQIELKNKKLKSEIAQKVSLSEVLTKAGEKGFMREPQVVNLSGDMTVALKPANP